MAPKDGLVVYAVLAFLAVTFGEFMTGGISTDPFSILGVFFVPPFAAVGLTYGLGVLLVREASVRLRKGWVGTLPLAAANAWVLQGVFTKVLFGPASSPNFGPLGSYGHFLGVNWVYVPIAIYFDAVLATLLPIFLASEIFPRTRDRRLLSDLSMVLVTAGLVLLAAWEDIYVNADNGILPSSAHPFVSSLDPVQLVILLVAVVGLSFCAYSLPKDLLLPTTALPAGSPWQMFGLGLAFTVSTLLVEGVSWKVVPWPAVDIALYGLWSVGVLWLIRQRIGRSENLSHSAALAAGLLAVWGFTDVFREAAGDLLVLPIALGVFATLGLLWKRGMARTGVNSLDHESETVRWNSSQGRFDAGARETIVSARLGTPAEVTRMGGAQGGEGRSSSPLGDDLDEVPIRVP